MPEKKRLIIKYGPSGSVYPDHTCFDTCKLMMDILNLPDAKQFETCTATENLLFAVRACVATRKIDTDLIDVILIDESDLRDPVHAAVDKDGRMSAMVPTYSHIDKCLEMLLGYTENE